MNWVIVPGAFNLTAWINLISLCTFQRSAVEEHKPQLWNLVTFISTCRHSYALKVMSDRSWQIRGAICKMFSLITSSSDSCYLVLTLNHQFAGIEA